MSRAACIALLALAGCAISSGSKGSAGRALASGCTIAVAACSIAPAHISDPKVRDGLAAACAARAAACAAGEVAIALIPTKDGGVRPCEAMPESEARLMSDHMRLPDGRWMGCFKSGAE